MKNFFLSAAAIFLLSYSSYSQFSPQAYQAGSDAVPANDARIQFWASGCTYELGWKNIADTNLGKPIVGNEGSVLGSPNLNVLSLGDGGAATLTFPHAIRNGEGPDFVIFENGFLHPTDSTLAYLELAFVEVSSDGVQFFRFPSTSLTQDSVQIDNFNWLDASKIHNLAGKYILGFGTPFDLEELKDQPGLDVNNITHVKIIDVVGSIDELYAQRDQEGRKINDPYPSAFPSGGFDLNAVGVIHASPTKIKQLAFGPSLQIYPNPGSDFIYLKRKEETHYALFNLEGKEILSGKFQGEEKISLRNFSSGNYILRWQSGVYHGVEKISKL